MGGHKGPLPTLPNSRPYRVRDMPCRLGRVPILQAGGHKGPLPTLPNSRPYDEVRSPHGVRSPYAVWSPWRDCSHRVGVDQPSSGTRVCHL